jgi:hypothetical protein
MDRTTVLRKALVIGASFNFGVAIILVYSPLRIIAGFPEPGSLVYVWIPALFVVLFGCLYIWLSLQREIHRQLVLLAAIGRLGGFLISVGCWLYGEITTQALLPAFGDLGFAIVFLYCLRSPAGNEKKP